MDKNDPINLISLNIVIFNICEKEKTFKFFVANNFIIFPIFPIIPTFPNISTNFLIFPNAALQSSLLF